MSNHVDRPDLLRIAIGTAALPEHAKSCAECALLLELFQKYAVAGATRLVPPLPSWVERASAIIPTKTARTWLAHLSFDSWQLAAPVGLRSSAQSEDRRMVYETESAYIDLRMEKTESGYSFIAKVDTRETELSGEPAQAHARKSPLPVYILLTQGRIPANPDGFHYWETRRLPRSISIEVGDTRIRLPELSWKRPARR